MIVQRRPAAELLQSVRQGYVNNHVIRCEIHCDNEDDQFHIPSSDHLQHCSE